MSMQDFTCQCIAFDEWDLDYYTKLFQEKIKRNPTNVECFDLAQSNRYYFYIEIFMLIIFLIINKTSIQAEEV
jgi:hypothetical protein